MHTLSALPVAARTNESLVEVSPSMVMRLNELSATSRTMSARHSLEMAASQQIKASSVAMSGLIIPAPLAIPLMVTLSCPSEIRWLTNFGAVSVVMIAVAAATQPSARCDSPIRPIVSCMRATGRRSPITPVEKGATADSARPRVLAAAAQSSSASRSPASPVAALALPLLMRRARTLPHSRFSAMLTGAARKLLFVKTAATLVASAKTISTTSSRARSSRSDVLMAAAALARLTPGTGSTSPNAGRPTLTLRSLTVTVLVFFSRTTWAALIAANLALAANESFRLRRCILRCLSTTPAGTCPFTIER